MSIEPAQTASSFDARALLTAIAWLRPGAAIGQGLAIAIVVTRLRVGLPLAPLLVGIAALLLATPVAFWRLRSPRPVSEAEAACHTAFDLAVLGWALYFTGGASNPFITLLLVPIALSAAALSARTTGVIVALAAALYAVLMVAHVPLPDMPVHGNGFPLHLTGMAINFGIATLLLWVLVGRMRRSLAAQREAVRRLRERALRDEGILAIATQAADAAHRLNTPLATVRTLLHELECGRTGVADTPASLHAMQHEIERCRVILQGMVDYGRHQLDGNAQAMSLGEYVRASVDRFRLLRPRAEVQVQVDAGLRDRHVAFQPALAHALLSLMQNALDASRQNGSDFVGLAVAAYSGRLEFTVTDQGHGLASALLDRPPLMSRKADGLGMGLSLARATVERLHGDIVADSRPGGTCVRIRMPIVGGARA